MARIKIVGPANGKHSYFDGQYVVEYDPSRDGIEPVTGLEVSCHLVTTPNPEEALQLPSREAFELWRSVDQRQPVRPDGRPNRPLTAFTVQIG